MGKIHPWDYIFKIVTLLLKSNKLGGLPIKYVII